MTYCFAHWSRYGQLGKTARMYYFTYGPSCSDKADHEWGTSSPYRKSEAGGVWASHASEIAYVFGNSFSSGCESDEAQSDSCYTCDPTTEERYIAGSSLRLTTVMQQLWTSFAKTGEPRADPELFTGTYSGKRSIDFGLH